MIRRRLFALILLALSYFTTLTGLTMRRDAEGNGQSDIPDLVEMGGVG